MATDIKDNDIDKVVSAIQKIVRGIEGIREAPDTPPETITKYPYAVCYPRQGTYKLGAPPTLKGMHSIWLEIHMARKDMPRDIERTMKYIRIIPDAIFDAYRDSESDLKAAIGPMGTITEIEYNYGVLSWLGTDTVGIRFYLNDIKIQTAVGG